MNDIELVIKEIIDEHNEIWCDIRANLKNYSYPKGQYCFTLTEVQIGVIAAGLVRRGIVKGKE